MAKAMTVSTKFTAVDKFSKKMGKMTRANQKFTSKTQRGMARVQRSSRRLSRTTSNLTSKMLNLKNAAGALIVGMAIRRTVGFVNSMASAADEAAKMGRQLDMSAQSLEEYRFAAQKSGVDQSMMESGMKTLNKRLGELQSGSGALLRHLEKMGKEGLINNLKNAKNTEEAFAILSDEMKNSETQLRKNHIATAAFSKGGQNLVRMMDQGSGAIEKQRKEFRKLAGEEFNEAGEKGESYMNTQAKMSAVIKGLKTTLANELIPEMEKTQKNIMGWVQNNRELIKTKIQAFVEKLTSAISWLSANGEKLLTILKYVIGAMVTLKAVNLAARAATLVSAIALGSYNLVLGITTGLQKKATLAVGQSKIAMVANTVATKVATAVQWAWAAAVNAGLWPVLAIIAAIAALVIGIRALIKNWDVVKATMVGVWEVIKSGFRIIKTALILPVKLLIEYIKGLGKILYYVFTGQFGKALKSGKKTFSNMKDSIVKDAKKIKSEAMSMGDKFQEGYDKSLNKNKDFEREDRKALNKQAQTEQLQQEREKRRDDRLLIRLQDDTGRAKVEEDTGGYLPEMEPTLGI